MAAEPPNVSRLLEYQRVVASFSRTAAEDLPLERLAQHLCAQVSYVTDIQKTKILQYRPRHQDALIIAGVGWKPGVVGTEALPADDKSPAGRSILTAAPVVIEDLSKNTEFTWSPLLRDHGVVCLANVPVMTDGETWGLLEVDLSAPCHFEDADIAFLTCCANMLGMAISRQRTHLKLAHAVEERARDKQLSETSLRELQHRTKNNLQMIVGMLSIHRKHATTENSKSRFDQVLERVRAIALAQDQLMFSTSASEVHFRDYLRSLCAKIPVAAPGVRIEVDADKASVPLDKAVAAGLIVNELVTNAAKYGFGEEQKGLIQVRFSFSKQTEQACLSVEDNGRGMGKAPKQGFGLNLVKALTGQLAGKLNYRDVPHGTRIDVTFPLPTSTLDTDEVDPELRVPNSL